ncbi:MAG TPA: response regulator [Patescibacteria group bacterium]|nr:response regulator [Patescibacteria group bacterium]
MAQARVLYIEDYPVVQTMYVEVLQKEFEVDVASDGKEALEKVKQNRYDVILLDLLLPQMTGLEFLRAYNEGGHQDAKTRIIVLSDFDNPATRTDVQKLGVSDYWIKVENTPHVLVDKLKETLAAS